jgi:hypothetical protein
MKTETLGLVFAGLALASSALAATVPLNVKTGLWDMTYVTTMSGMPPIPQSVLDKLPPDRKAKLLADMKARSGEKTRHEKECLTQKDLDDAAMKFDDEKESTCKHTITKSTSTHMEGTFACTGAHGAKGSMKVDAPDTQTMKSDVNTVSGTMTVHMLITGKWVATDCGKVKSRSSS